MTVMTLLSVQSAAFADEKLSPAKKSSPPERATAITAKNLDAALEPIQAELKSLRSDQQALQAQLHNMPEYSGDTSHLERTIDILRAALVLMGIGFIGGLIKLRSLARQIKS